MKNLFFKKESSKEYLENSNLNVTEYMENYMLFLNKCKTERETVDEIEKIAKENGFLLFEEKYKLGKLKKGDKIYFKNRNKAIILYIIGEEDLKLGLNILASHVDAPRIDIKQNPLYEEEGFAFLKTHYYGGIKKYQWFTIPLSLHGKIIRKDGEEISIIIGEDENDPVFFITDLLPHLAKDQMSKNIYEGFTGESLNILIGSDKDLDSKDNKVKSNILKLLNSKYGIEEEDFISAELEIVPSGKARKVGLDSSIIGAYGQDDRVCVYATLKAILDIKIPKRTSVGIFIDKEEVGSLGNTGLEGMFFKLTLSEILENILGKARDIDIMRIFNNSYSLSADTVAGYDPNFPDVLDKRNAPFLGNGVTLVKYTGEKGKYDTNDANSEYIFKIRSLLNKKNIPWQIGELGKVDQGGGGTIAYILANYGIETLDCCIPLLSIHSPYELSNIYDIYTSYLSYIEFLEMI